jgi:phospholipid transport system substrate-binding protein
MLNAVKFPPISLRALLAALFVAAFVVLQAPGVHAATADESFVQQNIDQGYAILNNRALAPRERAEKFRNFLAGIIDGKRIAVFTLGPYARGVPGAQLDQFTNAFTDFVAADLQHEIAANAGEAVAVTGSQVRASDDAIVTASLTGSPRGNGKAVDMGFRLRKTNGGVTVVDLQVEGVWMAMAERTEFSTWLHDHHGELSTLTLELESRAKSLWDDNARMRMTVSR